MTVSVPTWSMCAICSTLADPFDVDMIAEWVLEAVARTDFDAPGFCVVGLGSEIGSVGCRRAMVDLMRSMSTRHESTTGRSLAYVSAGRFDQQTTTRPHLDGGPDECLLMLGYEASEVDSELEFVDYARCARHLGLTPRVFLERHNPMFEAGRELLRPYTARVPCFARADYQIVCINNSSAPFERGRTWQGVLHTATIPHPNESQRRVVNSTMIARCDPGTPDDVGEAELSEFVTTTRVRRRGYATPDLDDDA